jgi:hypothetical protein
MLKCYAVRQFSDNSDSFVVNVLIFGSHVDSLCR